MNAISKCAKTTKRHKTKLKKNTRNLHNVMHFDGFRGRPFDSEGGGKAWHFLEINILILKMLEINNLSSSAKKINNLT